MHTVLTHGVFMCTKTLLYLLYHIFFTCQTLKTQTTKKHPTTRIGCLRLFKVCSKFNLYLKILWNLVKCPSQRT